MPFRNRADIRRFSLAVALAVILAAGLALAMRQPGEKPELGLFTTLPIYWNEAAGISDLLAEDRQAPWVRDVLESRYRLRPLDLLEAGGAEQANPLDGYDYLLLAQPRALSPGENVALDTWVRDGGRLLLLADPMLTAESIHPIGDARRPQDVALLSPILAHWGLRLEFDEAQPGGERMVPLFDTAIPVDLAGRLAPVDETHARRGDCRLLGDRLAARCVIGKGSVLIVADAAVLDDAADRRAPREAALGALLDHAFTDR